MICSNCGNPCQAAIRLASNALVCGDCLLSDRTIQVDATMDENAAIEDLREQMREMREFELN